MRKLIGKYQTSDKCGLIEVETFTQLFHCPRVDVVAVMMI